ncbi:MAG: peptidoglycan-binding domain-containing protein [Candidatus Omnitrophota bacterium]|nr:peptidoglycan-binding protein [Candidatus Omnitrophota bacterium]MBU1929202.1 peptidoglycan-binding protein [Candidatus Omnitrophota bacterium]MBU2035493.1 peptidoglycan-binding protein [Candidatus Omnitrophota bacterium]MBU2221251.1 peptidoglycan-binding protein [Candidatus Omnitrophota bacterium]MBU2258919.1 peptidoglycan-binding protein [Candidatus Omnitrophota bacterium]
MFNGKNVLLVLLGFIFVLVSGCATTARKPSLEAQGLKNQVMVLETRLKEKDQEIYDLKESQGRANEDKESVSKPVVHRKIDLMAYSRPTPKTIQAALKRANFYKGNIDGKIGKNTVEAIKEFQRSNKLHVDGKVGKRTWELLKAYAN